MSVMQDCGDVMISIRILGGIRFVPAHTLDDDERKRRFGLSEKLRLAVIDIESKVLAEVCAELGYDPDTIVHLLDQREQSESQDRQAEEEGRALKRAQRAGLPEPELGKRGANVKPRKPLTDSGPDA